jgi:acyl-CoA dehydrogenase
MCNSIFGGITLARLGTEAQKRAMLPALIDGSARFAMALTEPDAGTNSLALRSFAAKDGDGWRLNGQKIWITSIGEAAYVLIVARTKRIEDAKGKADGISLLMVPADRAGMTHQPIEKVGTNTLASSAVFFEDMRIEPNELIGTLDGGFRELLDVLNTERIVTASGLVGTADLAIRLGVDYAAERKLFGSTPIGAYQSIQFPIAEAKIYAESARLMNYKAATLYDCGDAYGSEANMAKWLAGHAAALATDRAMQTMGGMGYSKEFHVERLWRDARLFRIAPVSEEMVLNYVAQHDLGMARSY